MALTGSGAYYFQKATSSLGDASKQVLAVCYPREFEWYMIALELVDFSGCTIDYLTFPVMPNSIVKTEQNRNVVRKSMAGVTVLSNTALALGEIALQGNFGRSFKNLVNPEINVVTSEGVLQNSGIAYGIRAGKTDLYSLTSDKPVPKLEPRWFDFSVKTGYGVVKILQSILDKSVGVDKNGKPFRLLFYNLAFGESYQVVVPPNGVRFYQDMSNNMVWCYDLKFTIVAPLEAIGLGGASVRVKRLLSASLVQQTVDVVASAVEDSIASVTTLAYRGVAEIQEDIEQEKRLGEGA